MSTVFVDFIFWNVYFKYNFQGLMQCISPCLIQQQPLSKEPQLLLSETIQIIIIATIIQIHIPPSNIPPPPHGLQHGLQQHESPIAFYLRVICFCSRSRYCSNHHRCSWKVKLQEWWTIKLCCFHYRSNRFFQINQTSLYLLNNHSCLQNYYHSSQTKARIQE